LDRCLPKYSTHTVTPVYKRPPIFKQFFGKKALLYTGKYGKFDFFSVIKEKQMKMIGGDCYGNNL